MTTDELTTPARTPAPPLTDTTRRRRGRSTPTDHHAVTDARARIGRRRLAHRRPVRRSWGVPAGLFVGDVVAIALSAWWIGRGAIDPVVFAAPVLVARAVVRLYRPRMNLTVIDDLPRAIGSVLAGVGVALVITFATTDTVLSGTEPLARAGAFLLFSLVLQSVWFALCRRHRRARRGGRRTLVVGAGRTGRTVALALREHPELGLDPVGFADPDVSTELQLDEPLLLTDMSRLAETIAAHDVRTAVLAFAGAGEAHVDTVISVHQTGCDIFIVPSLFELHSDGPDVERVRGVPLLRLRPDPTLRWSWWLKRGFDVAAGVVGLALLAVPLAVVAAVILVDSGRPVLFWQERVGLDGRTFRLCKFRSMKPRNEAESQTTWNIAHDPRVSRVGHLIRRTSVDELPQLWNIVRGQMSLVGPRPERPTFVEKFSAEHERYWARHRVPVGLTGLAQVSGLRGDTSIRERARYDNYYIANWSLWLDVKVLALTAREVFGGRGR